MGWFDDLLGHCSNNQYYHFQIIFYENLSNIVKCFYFEMSDGGVSATIGIQGKLIISYY